MTPAEARYWEKVMARSAKLRPAMIRAITSMIAEIQARFTPAEIAKLIALGYVDDVVNGILSNESMDAAANAVRAELLNTMQESSKAALADIPNARQRISGAFNVLDPRVIESIRKLDTKVIGDLKKTAVAVVRSEAEKAIRLGVGPRAFAARLRSAVGLGPSDITAADNYRLALETGKVGKALSYKRRDHRYDSITKKGALSEAQITKMVAAYRARRIGLNAEAVARTAVLDAQKQGQALAMQQAIAAGYLDGERMVKTWVTVGDARVRDEHVAMQGETVAWDVPFSNGEMVCGESTYNCRCLPRYTQDKAGRPSITAAKVAEPVPMAPSIPLAAADVSPVAAIIKDNPTTEG